MSMQDPKVTVLMPVYNGEKYLRDAVLSILNQTFKDFEFLIINDGSTDNSLAILKTFQDSRVRVVNNDMNLQLPATLNKGLELARGTYIARMDCDDISLPERLARQVECLDANPDFGLCSTDIVSINAQGQVIDIPKDKIKGVPVEWRFFWENPIKHPTVMLRRSILADHNLTYRDIFAEDFDLWCRLALITRLRKLDYPLLHYRMAPESIFHSNPTPHFRQAILSSRTLAAAISKTTCPACQDDLTRFKSGIGQKPAVFELSGVLQWVEILLARAKDYWNWTEAEYRLARLDAQDRLYRYLKHFPEHYFQSYFKIWGVGKNRKPEPVHVHYLYCFVKKKFKKTVKRLIKKLIKKPLKRLKKRLRPKPHH